MPRDALNPEDRVGRFFFFHHGKECEPARSVVERAIRMPAKRVDIVKIKLVRESSMLYAARSISSPRDTAEFFRTLLGDADREHFVVMCLNAKNEPNAVQVVSTGTLSATLVHPREIFKDAILANAHSVVLAHNHPSGDPTPSREDLEVTHRLSPGWASCWASRSWTT